MTTDLQKEQVRGKRPVKRSKMYGFLIVIAALALLAGFFSWENNGIVISRFTYASDKVPEAFDGFVIAQISDLHNKRFGTGQERLLEKLSAAEPDLIVVTGDILDRRRYDFAPVAELLQGAVKLAPVVYVPGNHEGSSGRYGEIKAALLSLGVTVLDDASYTVSQGGDTVTVLGVLDPVFFPQTDAQETDATEMKRFLAAWKDEDGFKILLSHRAELLDVYAGEGMDLVFSGHAHGGQIRLPFIGGLYAPGQGAFPKYTGGRYDEGDTAMYVSRGLGNSAFPFRVFNRPELVVVTLKTE